MITRLRFPSVTSSATMPPSASAGLPSGAPTPGQASRPSIRATHGHRRGRPRARRATAAPRGGPRPGGLMGAGAYAVLDRGLWYGKSAPFRAVQTAPRRCGAGEVTPRRNAAPARAGRGHMFRPRRSLPDRPRWRTCQVPAAGETSSAFGAMGRGPSGVHPAAARIRAPRRHTAHPIARVRMCDKIFRMISQLRCRRQIRGAHLARVEETPRS